MEQMVVRNIGYAETEELRKYLDKPLGVFDVFREKKPGKKDKRKIFVGILADANYNHDDPDNEKLTLSMQALNSTNPCIYYLKNGRYKILGPRRRGNGFDIPATKKGTKVVFTGDCEEFEKNAKKTAYQVNWESIETQSFKEFLKHAKKFW